MKCQMTHTCISVFYTDITVITINAIVILTYDFKSIYISLMMVWPNQNPQFKKVRISCK